MRNSFVKSSRLLTPCGAVKRPKYFGFLLILSGLIRSLILLREENHRDIGSVSARQGAQGSAAFVNERAKFLAKLAPFLSKIFPRALFRRSLATAVPDTHDHALSLGEMSRPLRSELRAFVAEAK